METQAIELERAEAKRLYQEYRLHQHYETAIDREIRKAYRLIAQGRVIIRALESIKAAGLGEDGLPKLAIARADRQTCFLDLNRDGTAVFDCRPQRSWGPSPQQRFEFPAGTFTPERSVRQMGAQAPLIPIHLRPRQALESYHLLWEAEWRRVHPRDPMLLRRIGMSDMWLVVAAWDLTEVEMAALATRVTPQ